MYSTDCPQFWGQEVQRGGEGEQTQKTRKQEGEERTNREEQGGQEKSTQETKRQGEEEEQPEGEERAVGLPEQLMNQLTLENGAERLNNMHCDCC